METSVKSASLWCCITPERLQKTRMLMEAITSGWTGAKVRVGEPPNTDTPFIVWGQEWLALRIIPGAIFGGRPFFHIDNGYWNPARGTAIGYYRVTYRGMTPVLLQNPDRSRAIDVLRHLKPWRENGTHILYAVPGRHFGLALGINMDEWIRGTVDRIKAVTDRPIKIRPREAQGKPLESDLQDCWCLVTHSSNIAVEAAIAGTPVFVEPTSAAAPIGSTAFDLEHPVTPDNREEWLASLMCQQFTVKEMSNGTFRYWMKRVVVQCEPVNEIA